MLGSLGTVGGVGAAATGVAGFAVGSSSSSAPTNSMIAATIRPSATPMSVPPAGSHRLSEEVLRCIGELGLVGPYHGGRTKQ